ncbi:MAG: ATP-binding protein [Cloacibacillus sp.]
MLRKVSLETVMKWIFLFLALSMVLLTLGTRLHQNYQYKLKAAHDAAERLSRLLTHYDLNYSKEVIQNELGNYWRLAGAKEKPLLRLRSAEGELGFSPNPEAIYIDMVEEERYLILVGMLGLIIAVELAVFISYILTRPLRRLTWMCKEVASGRSVHLPQTHFSPYEFSELVDRFNLMSSQLDRWREVQRQLSRMDRLAALGEMISGLSHEIRNPLASMRIQTDLLQDEVERLSVGDGGAQEIDDAKEQIAVLGSEIDRLNTIVMQLLSFVRTQPAVTSPTKLDDLLPWAWAMLGAQAQKNGVRLLLKSNACDAPITVIADRDALRQVVMNLALNSVQAMDGLAGDRKRELAITIGYNRAMAGEERRGLITVEDTGCGIPSGIEHRIFDPFFTTKKDGTGLGLSIVQRIVESIGGTLSVDSGPEGTAFKIYLKLYDGGALDEHLDS